MKIIQKFNEDDKKKLEFMISFQYCTPYEAFGNRRLARKLICILTPVLYILSIYMYFVERYLIFILELLVAILATVWIIWYQFVGKNFEKKVHEIIYSALSGEAEVTVDESGIIYGNIVHKYDDIRNVIFYDNYCFVFLNNTRFFIMKINEEEKEYIEGILTEYDDIIQEFKTEPFNILKYFKRK